jgi:hypothetical protein
MAHYCVHDVRHRGRLYQVPLRYGIYDGAGRMQLVKGKKLRLTPRDLRKIELRARRSHAQAGYCEGPW